MKFQNETKPRNSIPEMGNSSSSEETRLANVSRRDRDQWERNFLEKEGDRRDVLRHVGGNYLLKALFGWIFKKVIDSSVDITIRQLVEGDSSSKFVEQI